MGYCRDNYAYMGYQALPPGPVQPTKPRETAIQKTLWACGKMGHIQAECPSQPDKYPFCNKGVSGTVDPRLSGLVGTWVCSDN